MSVGGNGASFIRSSALVHGLLIVLNFGAAARRFNLSELQAGASLLVSTHLDRAQEKLDDELQLRGDEGVIIELL